MSIEVGSIVEGKVVKITNFGAFVELPAGEKGLIHISEIANSYVKNVSDFLKENDVVKVKVIAVKGDGKLDFSIKQLEEKPQSLNPQRPQGPQRPQRPQTRKAYSSGSFEDMMKQFLKASGENLSVLKKRAEGKRR